MKRILFVAALFAAVSCGSKNNPDPGKSEIPEEVGTPTFAKGADIGWASEMEAEGRKFRLKDGKEADLLSVLRASGINSIRLRVWVDPYKGWSGKEDVLAMARRVSEAGLALMVDFHYSDFFADPSRQQIPAAWKADKADIDKMCAHVTAHTKEVLEALKAAGVTVNWVQVGNETRSGMLFGSGDLVWANKGSEFASYVKLSNAGYDAVKAVYPYAMVMPHLNNAYAASDNEWWVSSFKAQGGKFDALAFSHYPQECWNGKTRMEADEANRLALEFVQFAVEKYKVPVIVSEVGVKTPENEAEAKRLLQAFMTGIRKVKGCAGVFYWEPETDGSWKPKVYDDKSAIYRYTGKQETWDAYKMGAFTAAGAPSSVMEVFEY
ncbi:MAG: glycosyl hydrolase 53 family protein [Bacteroidales bacterium]|nr:glycosyl hydrolase 53 family protein [Bacteroidales bacterium]